MPPATNDYHARLLPSCGGDCFKKHPWICTTFTDWEDKDRPTRCPKLKHQIYCKGARLAIRNVAYWYVSKHSSNYGLSGIFLWLASILNDLEKWFEMTSRIELKWLWEMIIGQIVSVPHCNSFQHSICQSLQIQSWTNYIFFFCKKNSSFFQRMIDTGNHFTESTDWNIENWKHKVTHLLNR